MLPSEKKTGQNRNPRKDFSPPWFFPSRENSTWNRALIPQEERIAETLFPAGWGKCLTREKVPVTPVVKDTHSWTFRQWRTFYTNLGVLIFAQVLFSGCHLRYFRADEPHKTGDVLSCNSYFWENISKMQIDLHFLII